jgi:hypothetical protein
MKMNPARYVRNVTGRLLLGVFLSLPFLGHAAVPPAEKLLPPDTLLVVSAPDWKALAAVQEKSAPAQFWNDAAMKPFREKFTAKWNEELVQPLERELGVSFAEYGALLQGQVTFAVTQEGWQGSMTSGPQPAVLVLVDTRDRSESLRTNLAALRKKWSDAGKPIKTEKIRDVEFSIVPLTTNDVPLTLRQILPQAQDIEELGIEKESRPPTELVIGQKDSLLIVSTGVTAVEKILLRLGGSSLDSLGDQAEFQAGRNAVFREAPGFAWLNTRVLMEVVIKALTVADNPEAPSPIPMPDVNKMFTAAGLTAVRSVSFGYQHSEAGGLAELFVSAPESIRTGLIQLLAMESKDANPPAFVPADVVKFSRARLDGQKLIATLEKMVSAMFPEGLSTWNFLLNNANEAARLDNPNYDIRKDIFGNLGDDLITYEKKPTGTTLTEINAAPTIFLIGSPQPENLAASLRGLFAIVSPEGGNPKTREFLGRRIFSFSLPGSMAGGANRKLSYVASGGYVALSLDESILEEYLRSSESPARALRETAGFSAAVAKIGGASQGWLAYENESEYMRLVMEALRTSAAGTNRNELGSVLSSMIPFAPPEKQLKEWLDFSLLPPFDQVAKYFGFNVSAGRTTVNGLTFRYFQPTPAAARQE